MLREVATKTGRLTRRQATPGVGLTLIIPAGDALSAGNGAPRQAGQALNQLGLARPEGSWNGGTAGSIHPTRPWDREPTSKT